MSASQKENYRIKKHDFLPDFARFIISRNLIYLQSLNDDGVDSTFFFVSSTWLAQSTLLGCPSILYPVLLKVQDMPRFLLKVQGRPA
ncbi:hypothetical protein HanRHA438_Chr11g0506531 [Helianthus annuus]|nr:hypothetical protein HanRHA438_Chr11g0506531 [Helianthus annuus]